MKLFTLLILSVMSVNAFAYDCDKAPAKAAKGSNWKTCLQARDNTIADDFLLNTDGDLYAYINGVGLCQITNNVTSMKASAHKHDAAVLYFERQGDLYVAHGVKKSRQCPTMSKKVIMENVKDYSVVSNTNTTIVNVALSNGGKFLAWDDTKVVYSDILVKDYLMNSKNYGVKGKSFSSYVVFTQDFAGYITKVKGEGTGANGLLIGSKSTDKPYKSIQAFKKEANLE